MDQKDLMDRTLYSLKSRVNLERRYVSAIEELNAKEAHKLNISGNNLERHSLKYPLGELVSVVGAFQLPISYKIIYNRKKFMSK